MNKQKQKKIKCTKFSLLSRILLIKSTRKKRTQGKISDERAIGVVGEWADKSDNRYIFNEDGTMLIKGSLSETEGTFSVVEWKEDGSLLLTLVFGSDTMEFHFEFLSDGVTMQLCRPGTDIVHTWIRK